MKMLVEKKGLLLQIALEIQSWVDFWAWFNKWFFPPTNIRKWHRAVVWGKINEGEAWAVVGGSRDIFGGNIYRRTSVYFCSKHICIQLKRCWCVCILLMVHLIQICSGDGSGELQDGNSVAKSNTKIPNPTPKPEVFSYTQKTWTFKNSKILKPEHHETQNYKII